MFHTTVTPSSLGRRNPDTVDCLIPNMMALQPTATAKHPGKLEAVYKTGTHSSFHLWLRKQNDVLHRVFQKRYFIFHYTKIYVIRRMFWKWYFILHYAIIYVLCRMFWIQYFIFHNTIISYAKTAVDIYNRGGKWNIHFISQIIKVQYSQSNHRCSQWHQIRFSTFSLRHIYPTANNLLFWATFSLF